MTTGLGFPLTSEEGATLLDDLRAMTPLIYAHVQDAVAALLSH